MKPRHAVLDYLRQLRAGRDAGAETDRQLLHRFTQGDEAAFALLVVRHGPLVFNVCLRLLRHTQDAEDAFQATFLVLARKAAVLEWHESVASWLHEVACRVAGEARGRVARLRMRETLMDSPPQLPAPTEEDLGDRFAVLHQELCRLPEKYRQPLVLCYLEGKSREAAAQLLGWTPGAVKGRLERGRLMLGKRLARRGLATAAVLLTQPLTAAPSAALRGRTVELATTFVAGQAAPASVAVHLAEGVLRAMSPAHLSTMLGLFLVLVFGAGGLFAQKRLVQPVPADDKGPRVEASEPKIVLTLEHPDIVRGVAFTPDGKRLATACFDGAFRLWDAHSGKLLKLVEVPGRNSALAISPNGQLIAGGNDRGELIVWDAAMNKEVVSKRTRQGNVYHLAFSPDGKLLASANHLGTVSVWDPQTGAARHHLSGHDRRVWGVAWSPDGKTLASAGEDGTLKLWDPHAGKELKSFSIHTEYTACVAFSPDGKSLATGGYDNLLTLRDAAGKERLRVDIPGTPTVLFTADGKTLITADRENMLYVWDATTGKRIRSLEGHRQRVLVTALTRDGKRFVSAGEDGIAHIWNLQSAK